METTSDFNATPKVGENSMSEVIDLLEKMGQDAKWSHVSQDDIESALADAEIAPELRMAIAAGDQSSLQAWLELVPLCGMYAPGEEDEEENENPEKVPPGEEDD